MSRLIEAGPGHWAHASGALWLAEQRTLIIADAHLGYAWAQRRRGQLAPPVDALSRDKLRAAVSEVEPGTIVFLGDVVHAPRPDPREHELVESTLRELARTARVVIVLGNHDRGFARDYPDLGIELVTEWTGGGLSGVHGHKTRDSGPGLVVAGHFHPAIAVRDDAGASQRIPVFLIGASAYILPAFSPFSAGLVVNARVPKPVRSLLGPGEIDVIAATGKRVVKLGPLTRVRRHAPDRR